MKHVLLVETGPIFKHKYLEKILNSAASVLLLKNSSVRTKENDWYRTYFSEEKVIWSPFRHIESAIEIIEEHLKISGIRLSGLLTYQEEAVLTTQSISAALGLPTICLGNPGPLRNKAAMRSSLCDFGIPQPKHIICSNGEEAVKAVEAITVPCVIKPAELLASLGVRKIENFDEALILKAFENAHNVDIHEEDLKHGFNISSEVLVEEYIPTDQEISIEGVVYRGQMTIIAVTKKYLGPEPEFEEIGHATPFLLDQKTYSLVEEVLHKATDALKLNDTIFHAEFRLRENNLPVLIEIAARLGGDSIPLLVELATGVDMFGVAISCATNEPIQLCRTSNEIHAIRFITNSGAASALMGKKVEIEKLPFVKEFVLYPEASEGRFGHVIWHGSSIEEIEATCPIPG